MDHTRCYKEERKLWQELLEPGESGAFRFPFFGVSRGPAGLGLRVHPSWNQVSCAYRRRLIRVRPMPTTKASARRICQALGPEPPRPATPHEHPPFEASAKPSRDRPSPTPASRPGASASTCDARASWFCGPNTPSLTTPSPAPASIDENPASRPLATPIASPVATLAPSCELDATMSLLPESTENAS